MCDHEHYAELDDRVDKLETRLTAVETSLTDMRSENAAGFRDVKDTLARIYDERAKWGEWARENIGKVIKWVGLIVLAACGINQAATIIKSVSSAF